jgi:hypothetical protein
MPVQLNARLIAITQHHVLLLDPTAHPLYLRPGYHFHLRNDYLLPTEIIDDLGQRLPAPECYEWLERHGDAFPRADLVGQLASTGAKYSAFIKEVDLIELQIFAMETSPAFPPPRVNLAVELLTPPEGLALAPADSPVPAFARALTCYRLHPRVTRETRDIILTRLVTTHRDDWQLTFADLATL